MISTNYDLIVDSALMALSENRPSPGSEGRLPNYRCDISTPACADVKAASARSSSCMVLSP